MLTEKLPSSASVGPDDADAIAPVDPFHLLRPANAEHLAALIAAWDPDGRSGPSIAPLRFVASLFIEEFRRLAPAALCAEVEVLLDLPATPPADARDDLDHAVIARSLYLNDSGLHSVLSLGVLLLDAPYFSTFRRDMLAIAAKVDAEQFSEGTSTAGAENALIDKENDESEVHFWQSVCRHLRQQGPVMLQEFERLSEMFFDMSQALAHVHDPTGATPAPILLTSADLRTRRRRLQKLLDHNSHALALAFGPAPAPQAALPAAEITHLQTRARANAADWRTLRATDTAALPSADLLRDLHAHLTLASSAVTYLLRLLPPGHPLRRGLRAHAPLTREALRSFSEANTGPVLHQVVDRRPADLYHTLVVAQLVLAAPLRTAVRTTLCREVIGFAPRGFDLLAVGTEVFAESFLLTAAEWSIGLVRADDPATAAPPAEQEAALAALATHRAALTELFAAAGGLGEAAAPAALARQGPFLRLTPTDLQLPLLRLLTLHVPTLGQLVDHPFAKGLHELSGFRPTEQLDGFYERLLHHRAGQALMLSVEEAVMVYHLLHGGALLLLRGTGAWLTQVLRRRLHAESLTDPELEASYARLLFLLSSESTFERFRATLRPLLDSFGKALQRLHPHHARVEAARAEVAALASKVLS